MITADFLLSPQEARHYLQNSVAFQVTLIGWPLEDLPYTPTLLQSMEISMHLYSKEYY